MSNTETLLKEKQGESEYLAQEKARVLHNAARNNLISFCQAVDPRYKPNWHHAVIAKKLEHAMARVEKNQKVRLILTMPPRHGKSELATIKFPSWVLGHHPDWNIITSSYSALPSKTLALTGTRYFQQRLRFRIGLGV